MIVKTDGSFAASHITRAPEEPLIAQHLPARAGVALRADILRGQLRACGDGAQGPHLQLVIMIFRNLLSRLEMDEKCFTFPFN